LNDSAASLRKEATINAARLKAGDIGTNDLQQIEVAASRLELDAQSAADSSVSARIQLVALLGLTPEYKGLALSDSLRSLAVEPLAGLPAESTNSSSGVSDLALVLQRPDLVAARKDVAKAQADLGLAKAQRIPDPTFLGQWERQPPDQNQTVGLGLSFPLPLWNRNRGGIAAAQSGVSAAEVALHRAETSAAADLAVARQQLATASHRQGEYSQNLVPKSAAVRESITYAYQKGGASLIDLLAVQRTDNELRLASAQAAADAANARIALRAALTQTH
jgi:cobalt-zinc-cadmium efflux system outer membrane protein